MFKIMLGRFNLTAFLTKKKKEDSKPDKKKPVKQKTVKQSPPKKANGGTLSVFHRRLILLLIAVLVFLVVALIVVGSAGGFSDGHHVKTVSITTTTPPTEPAVVLPTKVEVENYLLSVWYTGIDRSVIERKLKARFPDMPLQELPLAPGGSAYIIVDVREGQFYIQGSNLEPLVPR